MVQYNETLNLSPTFWQQMIVRYRKNNLVRDTIFKIPHSHKLHGAKQCLVRKERPRNSMKIRVYGLPSLAEKGLGQLAAPNTQPQLFSTYIYIGCNDR
jgi:hypothetical protein